MLRGAKHLAIRRTRPFALLRVTAFESCAFVVEIALDFDRLAGPQRLDYAGLRFGDRQRVAR